MTGCGGRAVRRALGAARGAAARTGRRSCWTRSGFDERMRAAAFVVTGEGRIDEQTLQGKLVGEVATRCRQAGRALPRRGRQDRPGPVRAAHPRLRVADGGDDAGGARGRGRAQAAGRASDAPRGCRRWAWRSLKSFYDDQMTHHAAALTYYALMSLFPAVLLGPLAAGPARPVPRDLQRDRRLPARRRARLGGRAAGPLAARGAPDRARRRRRW